MLANVLSSKTPCCRDSLEEFSRLVQSERKATIAQMTPIYSEDIQNISESTIRQTLKQMAYISKKLHQVALCCQRRTKT